MEELLEECRPIERAELSKPSKKIYVLKVKNSPGERIICIKLQMGQN